METIKKFTVNSEIHDLMSVSKNLSIEKCLLGLLLDNGERIREIIEDIKIEDFHERKHQDIYQVMLNCYRDDIPINPISIANELQKTGKTIDTIDIIDLANFTWLGNSSIKYYVEELKKARKKGKVAKLLIETKEKLKVCPTEYIHQDIVNLINLVNDNGKRNESLILSEQTNTMEKKIKEYFFNKGKIAGLNTRYKRLNANVPFLPGDYIVVAGQSRLGKSILALNFVYNIAIAEKKPVAYFTLEMSREEIELRLMSLHSGYSTQNIMKGMVAPSLINFDALKELPIIITELGSTTVDIIVTKLILLKQKYPELCFVAIDAINFISDKRGENRSQEITDISGKLRDIAQKLKIALLLVCQLPKSATATGRKPRLEDIKDSGSIGYDCDIALFPHWNIDKFLEQQASSEMRVIEVELIVEKQRRGIWGKNIFFDLIPSEMIFVEQCLR